MSRDEQGEGGPPECCTQEVKRDVSCLVITKNSIKVNGLIPGEIKPPSYERELSHFEPRNTYNNNNQIFVDHCMLLTEPFLNVE